MRMFLPSYRRKFRLNWRKQFPKDDHPDHPASEPGADTGWPGTGDAGYAGINKDLNRGFSGTMPICEHYQCGEQLRE